VGWTRALNLSRRWWETYATARRRLDRSYWGYSAAHSFRDCSSAVDIATMANVHHRHYSVLVIDSIDNSVGPATCAEFVIYPRKKPLVGPARR
jgi:hypothetical protein